MKMNFYFIVGPQAVGKMTVGQELEKLSGAKLFFNHMTIDLVSNFFDYGTKEGSYLVNSYRELLFKTVASQSKYPGFIFTFVCDFDSEDGLEYIYYVCNMFKDAGHDVYIIELYADYATRKVRNISENRISFKPSKKNQTRAEMIFEIFEEKLRTTSYDGEIIWDKYVRIDNTNMLPQETARYILDYFVSK